MKATSFEMLRDATTACSLPANKILTALSSDKSLLDHFYLSGYEGLCLSLNHRDLTKAIITSAVPFEGELLVIGNSEACDLWFSVCAETHIQLSFIDFDEPNLAEIAETILEANKRITHVLCSTLLSVETIGEIGRVAHKHRCALIADNTTDDLTMADIEKSGIDFAIAAANTEADTTSMIVARRSRLVMTEGNARHAELDVYALWQDAVAARTFAWSPMA